MVRKEGQRGVLCQQKIEKWCFPSSIPKQGHVYPLGFYCDNYVNLCGLL